MATDNAHVRALKDAYGRWHQTKGGSVDHWMTLVADEIAFKSAGADNPHVAFAANYSKREELGQYFNALLADWDMVHFTVDEFVADGDVVVMRGRTGWKNKRTQKVCDTPKIDFWRFKNGKAIEYHEYFDTAAAQAAATP